MQDEKVKKIWGQIQEPILNNIKVQLLKTYPAEILHYFNPKIYTIVKYYMKYLPPFVAENEAQDLVTIAQLEFLETLKTWNPQKGKFIWPLAYAKINGAMKDHIRYITKSDPSTLYEWVKDAAYFYLTLNKTSNFEYTVETSMQLKEAMKILTEKEKKVLVDHIYKDLTFQEIGKKLKISESQISRIYKTILEKLKKEFTKNQSD
jgi:RNA polymerase sigma factor (sigma-70 family)